MCETLPTDKPTFWPNQANNIADIVDFIVTPNVSVNYMHVEEVWDINSDYLKIYMGLKNAHNF